MSERRVVITGIGLVTPLGVGTRPTWEAVLQGRSGVGPITRFDTTDYPVRIAAEVKEFDPEVHVDVVKKDLKKMDTFIHYALAASRMAMEDAGTGPNPDDADRFGVNIGSGIGGLLLIEREHKVLLERGPRRITPFFIPGLIVNLASGNVSIRYGLKGPNSAVSTACATGLHAIGDAFEVIRRGAADAMLAGGTEAVICPLAVGGFAAMRALSTRNDDPARASRPFDAQRDGFVMGEGAGVLVLEELERAKRRGARVYAEIAGYGMSGDAYHISAPSEDGDGPIRAMSAALEQARISPEDVQYVNAHGTATPDGDKVETLAIKRLFGDHARRLAVSSTKSMIGHLLGAAGGVETAMTALTLHHQVIHPTVNLEYPDPECDLDYVSGGARETRVDCALKNSFGFGGTNAAILLRRFAG